MGALGLFLARLFTPVASSGMELIRGYIPILLTAALASTPLIRKLMAKWDSPLAEYGKILACALGMLLCVAALASQSYNPFIYFRF